MPTLLAIRGPLTGARIELGEGQTTLGRAPECTIVLADSTVSRIHAAIHSQRLGWIVTDNESAAGTMLNGAIIRTPTALAPNDEIRIGHSIFLFDSEFDLQNADFTDNIVYLSAPQEDTLAVAPIASLSSSEAVAIPTGPDSRERHGTELLEEIGDLFDSSRVAFGDALRATTQRMARLLRADVALLMLYDHGAQTLRASAAVAKENVIADRTILQRVFNENRSLLLSDNPALAEHPAAGAPTSPRARSVVAAPIIVEDAKLGVVYFERQELDVYTLKDLRLVQSLGKLLGVFIEARQKALAIQQRSSFSETDSPVLGSSTRFRRTMEMVQRVADSPATILLIGETGTGKEVLAAEIHRLSARGRKGQPFVPVNCAAIPEALFEAELFGHEKGAFTGAHKMRQGYVEAAQGGTLFLDEIGELSLALQPKLLRFLQEHTFTRVGGNRAHRAEVRVIAATNRNLAEDVRTNRFREDLYHRLTVFPIDVPPLRERREDIRLLADHFSRIYCKALRKEILGISDDALIMLEKYEWPGNVRELANCMERAVLLSDEKILLPRHFLLARPGSTILQRPTLALAGVSTSEEETTQQWESLAEVEKDHILKVLRAFDNNQVKASEVLGIHRNTLRKKLQEYGILKESE
ncbi:sigma 54-interacting transcriptional regulator [Candidatus Sumerlaeota bacterium]|nr:sigma 54-interacting transcriptional regulator [Candidatus Sumerlaeota bacterium]